MDLIITDYMDGRMDKTGLERLEDHLMDCHDCRLFFNEVKQNAVLPFQQSPSQPVPSELWDAVYQQIEQEKDGGRFLEEFLAKIRGFIVFPRLVPLFASVIVIFLVGSVTLNTIRVQKAQAREQGDYLVSLLSPAESFSTSDKSDLGPIEHYFL